MVFEVYIKKEMGNQIGTIINQPIKKFTVTALDINNGLLKKGNYYIPISHILFIKES